MGREDFWKRRKYLPVRDGSINLPVPLPLETSVRTTISQCDTKALQQFIRIFFRIGQMFRRSGGDVVYGTSAHGCRRRAYRGRTAKFP